METSAVQAAAGGLSPLSSATNADLGKEDFLKLLVAQLEHQDPLQPMENSDFVAQLAQFSSLEQIVNVNSNLELLQVAQTAMTNSQVAGLIGKRVEAAGDTLNWSGSGTAGINFDLGAPAAEVTAKVLDGEGNLLRTIDVGSRPAGLNSVVWDGKDEMGNAMPAGRYRLAVTAEDGRGGSIVSSTKYGGTVTGISYRGGSAVLEIGDATVPLSDIVSVRAPQSGIGNGS